MWGHHHLRITEVLVITCTDKATLVGTNKGQKDKIDQGKSFICFMASGTHPTDIGQNVNRTGVAIVGLTIFKTSVNN